MSLKFVPPAGKTPVSYRMFAKGSTGEIQLYGNIGQSWWGDGISAKQFSIDLKALGKVTNIDIRINSDGGDVFEGRAMYSLLAQHAAKKTVYVDGVAASIASLIAMVGDEIIMGDGTFVMIHNAWGVAIGDTREMARVSSLLESVNSTLVDTYASRTGNAKGDIQAWMDSETWMPAKDALSKKFATKVSEPVKMAAMAVRPNIFNFKKLPAALRPNRAAALKLIEGMRAA